MSGEGQSHQLCWYVVHTHPKQEERAEKNLQAWQVETLSPKIKERRLSRFSDDPIYTVRPLFPRYIFARFSISDLYHKIRFTRGVRALVSFNEYPSPVDDCVIEAIRSRIAKDGLVTVGEQFKRGDEVVITKGPLKNLIGVFEREMTGANRVELLLRTVSSQTRAVVSKDMITSGRNLPDARYCEEPHLIH